MMGRQAATGPLADRLARRRLLRILGAGAAGLLAACEIPGGAPPESTAPPAAAPPAAPTPVPSVPAGAETPSPQPIALRLELALSWPSQALAALAQNLGQSRWRASITPTSQAAIEQLTGATAEADLVSPADPARMAAAGRLRALPPGLVWAGRSSWHSEALASGNPSADEIVGLPLGLRARLFTYRQDLLGPPADLAEWRAATAALTRHDERFVRFAGIDLTPAMNDPRWLVFGDRECGRGGCYSADGAKFMRSLFVDPGVAFRRDHPRTEWPLSALAAGAAASGFSDWPRLQRQVTGSRLRSRLATANAPAGLTALEGGGRLWLAVPQGSRGAGLEALAELDLHALSTGVAAAAQMLPSDVSALADMAARDANLGPLLGPRLRLYDWRLGLGPRLGSLAGVTHRALALGRRPVEELLIQFKQALAQGDQ